MRLYLQKKPGASRRQKIGWRRKKGLCPGSFCVFFSNRPGPRTFILRRERTNERKEKVSVEVEGNKVKRTNRKFSFGKGKISFQNTTEEELG